MTLSTRVIRATALGPTKMGHHSVSKNSLASKHSLSKPSFLAPDSLLSFHVKHLQRCKKSKQVRFQEKSSVAKVLGRDEMTQQEQNETWYSKADLATIARDRKLAIRAYRKVRGNVNALPAEVCMRGLEDQMSRRANLDKRSRMVSVLQAVFDEQNQQSFLGIKDPASIREASMKESRLSLISAMELATEDAREAYRPEGRVLSTKTPPFTRPPRPSRISLDAKTRTFVIGTLEEALSIID